ncbi:MAG: heme o synthase [Bacteroidota bacterium]|jgi:protoheme IX farnesyltransferase|nr:heme o synthase [Sphingobacteriales bacterium]
MNEARTIAEKNEWISGISLLKQKVTDYNQLIKTRLTFLVVFSAVITYLTASTGSTINWFEVMILALGGTLVVGASNGINQIIEKDFDKLMVRTANRPVATKRMSSTEAGLASLIMGISGVYLIAAFLNPLCGWLSLASLVSYAFIYTPLKRVSPISVFVGAFPGAFPPLLGWVAFTGSITTEAIIFFGVQFFWQFPHFWSIAWILDDDYKRAGFKMLPVYGRNKKSAFQVLIFTSMLLPVGLLPFVEGYTGLVSALVCIAGAGLLIWYALKLYRSCENADAKKLMFASFFYLPLVQIAYLIDKI